MPRDAYISCQISDVIYKVLLDGFACEYGSCIYWVGFEIDGNNMTSHDNPSTYHVYHKEDHQKTYFKIAKTDSDTEFQRQKLTNPGQPPKGP